MGVIVDRTPIRGTHSTEIEAKILACGGDSSSICHISSNSRWKCSLIESRPPALTVRPILVCFIAKYFIRILRSRRVCIER